MVTIVFINNRIKHICSLISRKIIEYIGYIIILLQMHQTKSEILGDIMLAVTVYLYYQLYWSCRFVGRLPRDINTITHIGEKSFLDQATTKFSGACGRPELG